MTTIMESLGVNKSRVLGLDHSSTSLAFGLFVDGKPNLWGKLLYHQKANNIAKFKMMPGMVDAIIEATQPTFIMLEKSIIINSPATGVMLAEINGGLMCLLANKGYDLETVIPVTWQAYHGNKKVYKAKEPFKSMTAKEREHFKKIQTINKINEHWPWVHVDDDNVADAIAISCYAAGVSMKEEV